MRELNADERKELSRLCNEEGYGLYNARARVIRERLMREAASAPDLETLCNVVAELIELSLIYR